MPGLEDRALNHMELGSTCGFGGRDDDRARPAPPDKGKLFTIGSPLRRRLPYSRGDYRHLTKASFGHVIGLGDEHLHIVRNGGDPPGQ